MGRDEAGIGVRHQVLRACQDGHEVGQRLPARPDHLSVQEHATPPHWQQIQVGIVWDNRGLGPVLYMCLFSSGK